RDLRSQPATSAHSRYPSSIDNVITPKPILPTPTHTSLPTKRQCMIVFLWE
ncbi:hypothetical protein BGY98DRAFT_997859, partial [Russula aff. rugulosa BPL654]